MWTLGRSPGKLGEQQPFGSHPLVERTVGRGIHDAAHCQDADGATARIQCRQMTHRIETSRHPANDHEPTPRGRRREGAANLGTVERVVSAPHDRDRGSIEQADGPQEKQHRRRLADGAEQRGIFHILRGHDPGAHFLGLAVADGTLPRLVPRGPQLLQRGKTRATHKNANGAEWAPSEGCRLEVEWRDGGVRCPVSSRWPSTWPVRRLVSHSSSVPSIPIPSSRPSRLSAISSPRSLPSTILFQFLQAGSRRGRNGDHTAGIVQLQRRQRISGGQQVPLGQYDDMGLLMSASL